MLIGNRDLFAIELHQVLPTWERRYAPEVAAWAAFSVWVGGANLCEHRVEGEATLREAFFVPLVPIADWLVRNSSALSVEERAPWLPTRERLHQSVHDWGGKVRPASMSEDQWLDARDGFWARHFIAAGADGARLPNISLMREDDWLVFSWAPPKFIGGPVVELLNRDGTATTPWEASWAVLREFVTRVAGWVQEAGLGDRFPWVNSPESVFGAGASTDAAIELYCARSIASLQDLVGGTPDTLRSMLSLGSAATEPAASHVCQVIRDLPPVPSTGIGSAVRDIGVRATAATTLAPWLEGRALAREATRPATTPEQQGQLAAQALRAERAMNGSPAQNLGSVLDEFSADHRVSSLRVRSERMLVAAREDGRPAVTILSTPRTRKTWGCRFEQARALGHLLLDPLREGVLGAASTPFAQHIRRRRSGAFAAEFLFPLEAIEQASGGVLDGASDPDTFHALLAQYSIGAQTAAHQMYNHGFLSSESVRDELIAQFAAEG